MALQRESSRLIDRRLGYEVLLSVLAFGGAMYLAVGMAGLLNVPEVRPWFVAPYAALALWFLYCGVRTVNGRLRYSACMIAAAVMFGAVLFAYDVTHGRAQLHGGSGATPYYVFWPWWHG